MKRDTDTDLADDLAIDLDNPFAGVYLEDRIGRRSKLSQSQRRIVRQWLEQKREKCGGCGCRITARRIHIVTVGPLKAQRKEAIHPFCLQKLQRSNPDASTVMPLTSEEVCLAALQNEVAEREPAVEAEVEAPRIFAIA